MEILAGLAGKGPLFDMHVHPFNIADPLPGYKETSPGSGVFGQDSGGRDYEPPVLEYSRFEDQRAWENAVQNPGLLRKFYLLKSRSLYRFTGPGVFREHMDLAGVSHALLLPIALPGDEGDLQIAEMARIFGKQSGFSLAYSVPDNCRTQDIVDRVGNARNMYGISAIKIQPAITGIDLLSREGGERLHMILEASRKHRLPVLIHGGYTRGFAAEERVAFGCLDKLMRVDWKTTTQPVVIAHAGLYDCPKSEVRNCSFPQISRLLEKNEHLLVDISGLPSWAMEMIFEKIDAGKILFGSDGLYNPIWAVAACAIEAIIKTGNPPERIFHKIAHENPKRYFECFKNL